MTTSKFRVLPYKQGSASAKALALAMGGKVLRLEGSKNKIKPGMIFINWGNTDPPENHMCILNDNHTQAGCRMLNLPSYIRRASNKKLFFELMKETGNEELVPPFWTNRNDIPEEAFPIVCRTVLAGHSGDGIVLAIDPESLVDAPLYTKYIKKKDEYRVHVGRKETSDGPKYNAFATQQKARSTQAEEVNWQIRNHRNGFIYKRNGINPPESVISAAIKALEVSGLDFGAIDILWNDKQQRPYVLEINTAPGLEGQTVQDYAEWFKSEIFSE